MSVNVCSKEPFGTEKIPCFFKNLVGAAVGNIHMTILMTVSTVHEEVDFVLTSDGEPVWVIEVKSTERLKEKDFSGLIAFSEDFPSIRRTLIAHVPVAKTRPYGIEILPPLEFLEELE